MPSIENNTPSKSTQKQQTTVSAQPIEKLYNGREITNIQNTMIAKCGWISASVMAIGHNAG